MSEKIQKYVLIGAMILSVVVVLLDVLVWRP